jgi:hypothetical protein
MSIVELCMSWPARIVDMGMVPVSQVSSESGEACDQGDAEAAGCEDRSAL